MNGDDLPAVTVFGGINGPGQSRLEPVDVFHGQQEIPPIILHQRPELTPGQAIGELLKQFADARLTNEDLDAYNVAFQMIEGDLSIISPVREALSMLEHVQWERPEPKAFAADATRMNVLIFRTPKRTPNEIKMVWLDKPELA